MRQRLPRDVDRLRRHCRAAVGHVYRSGVIEWGCVKDHIAQRGNMIPAKSTVRTISDSDWHPMATCRWRCERGTLHLWRVRLSDSPNLQTHGLSDQEQVRAMQFKNDKDRQRFTVRRLALRRLLARYNRTSPQDIEFRHTKHGKPIAFDVRNHSLLPFSASSRDRIALIAFGFTALGVDVENTRRDLEIHTIASQFFHPGEASGIQAIPEALQRDAFFSCWTRKEAYIKAIGLGLHQPLNSFRVSLSKDTPELIWRDASIDDAQEWTLWSIMPADGYIGALIHTSEIHTIRCFEYE